MDINVYFKSFLDSAAEAVFICDINYRIIYLNPVASVEYARYGGYDILGKDLHTFLDIEDESKITMVIEWFKESIDNNKVFAKHVQKLNMDLYITALRNDKGELIGFCNRRRCRTPEKTSPYYME